MLKIQGDRIDRGYISQWAVRLGLEREWEHVLARAPVG